MLCMIMNLILFCEIVASQDDDLQLSIRTTSYSGTIEIDYTQNSSISFMNQDGAQLGLVRSVATYDKGPVVVSGELPSFHTMCSIFLCLITGSTY